jgi:hypothetical protein
MGLPSGSANAAIRLTGISAGRHDAGAAERYRAGECVIDVVDPEIDDDPGVGAAGTSLADPARRLAAFAADERAGLVEQVDPASRTSPGRRVALAARQGWRRRTMQVQGGRSASCRSSLAELVMLGRR